MASNVTDLLQFVILTNLRNVLSCHSLAVYFYSLILRFASWHSHTLCVYCLDWQCESSCIWTWTLSLLWLVAAANVGMILFFVQTVCIYDLSWTSNYTLISNLKVKCQTWIDSTRCCSCYSVYSHKNTGNLIHRSYMKKCSKVNSTLFAVHLVCPLNPGKPVNLVFKT